MRTTLSRIPPFHLRKKRDEKECARKVESNLKSKSQKKGARERKKIHCGGVIKYASIPWTLQQLLLCATQSLFTCDTQGPGSSGAGDNADNQSTCSSSHSPPLAQGHSSSNLLDCKTNPAQYVLVQGWQLLALAVSLFLPRNNRLLWYLKLHLQRNAETKWVTRRGFYIDGRGEIVCTATYCRLFITAFFLFLNWMWNLW